MTDYPLYIYISLFIYVSGCIHMFWNKFWSFLYVCVYKWINELVFKKWAIEWVIEDHMFMFLKHMFRINIWCIGFWGFVVCTVKEIVMVEVGTTKNTITTIFSLSLSLLNLFTFCFWATTTKLSHQLLLLLKNGYFSCFSFILFSYLIKLK